MIWISWFIVCVPSHSPPGPGHTLADPGDQHHGLGLGLVTILIIITVALTMLYIRYTASRYKQDKTEQISHYEVKSQIYHLPIYNNMNVFRHRRSNNFGVDFLSNMDRFWPDWLWINPDRPWIIFYSGISAVNRSSTSYRPSPVHISVQISGY